jgi:hypothetical protein
VDAFEEVWHRYRLGTTVDSPEFPEVHNRISGAYPNALRWEKTNAEQHAASQAMWVQYDHLLAHALGGTNELSNLVVACAPCNFRRMPPERTAPEFAKAQRERRKVEALFAELKNQIGLRRLRLRRLKFVREQFFLAAAAQNLKRLVRFLSQPTTPTVEAAS